MALPRVNRSPNFILGCLFSRSYWQTEKNTGEENKLKKKKKVSIYIYENRDEKYQGRSWLALQSCEWSNDELVNCTWPTEGVSIPDNRRATCCLFCELPGCVGAWCRSTWIENIWEKFSKMFFKASLFSQILCISRVGLGQSSISQLEI